MSNHVSSEVYKRQMGSLSRKAVMVLFADKASDNGTGIWAAKQTMADELDTSKQTVITTIKGLMVDGLVIEVGHRKCQNGYLVEYAIDMRVLRALPLVKAHQIDRSNSLTGQAALPVKPFDPTSQAALPDRSSCLTLTSLEPSLNQKPPNPLARGRERASIPDDWILTGIDDLPLAIGAAARQWPDGAYAAEGAAFHQHWRGRGTKRPDWAASWAARVPALHSAVMRSAKMGIVYRVTSGAPGGAVVPLRAPVWAKKREDDQSAALHSAICEIVGREVWAQWFEQAALIFEDIGLVVIAPSRFHASQLETVHRPSIDQALAAMGRAIDWATFSGASGPAPVKKGAIARG